jgi:hypothetical protein
MTIRVNGGIINKQTLSGGLRFFKIVGPFAWTMSDGSVNLPVATSGGGTFPPATTTYFQVANGLPVPGSAAEIALRTITDKSDIVVIGLVPVNIGATTAEIHIAVSASAFGWGSDVPPYGVPPANQDEDQLPITPTNAALEMQAAIRALTPGITTITVPTTTGSINPQNVPATTTISFSTTTVVEVSFSLGTLTYYTLA